MILLLSTAKNSNIRYYTRIIWAEDYYTSEKLAFVRDFHEKTFDKEAVKELARYMETDSTGDNSTLQRVDIHCSLNQVSWGNLAVSQVGDAVFNVSELAAQTATINGHYIVSAGTGNDTRYFYVEEYYRIRYTTDRVYLLDFVLPWCCWPSIFWSAARHREVHNFLSCDKGLIMKRDLYRIKNNFE